MNALHSLAKVSWDLESRLISKMGEIVDLLSARKSAWVIKEEQIVFREERDNEKFLRYVAELQQLIERQRFEETMKRSR